MKNVLILFVFAMLAMGAWSQDIPNNPTTVERPVIFSGSGHKPKLVEDMPEGWYYCDTRMLTIEFPTAGFVPYTLSISSELTAAEKAAAHTFPRSSAMKPKPSFRNCSDDPQENEGMILPSIFE